MGRVIVLIPLALIVPAHVSLGKVVDDATDKWLRKRLKASYQRPANLDHTTLAKWGRHHDNAARSSAEQMREGQSPSPGKSDGKVQAKAGEPASSTMSPTVGVPSGRSSIEKGNTSSIRAPHAKLPHVYTDVGPTIGKVVLAGDIGGTNSRFKLYRVMISEEIKERQRAPGECIYENEYRNERYSSLLLVMKQFFLDASKNAVGGGFRTPTAAVLGVAGVVTANQARLTNIDWVVDGYALEKALGIPQIEILNDFVVQGYGILTLGSEDVICLHDAPSMPGAPIACLGAGTGLGECFLCPGPGGQYKCYPSEGGHKEWAPRGEGSDEKQIELLKYLKVKFSEWNRISVERVVSGPGICNIYEFLAFNSPKTVDKDVHNKFLASRKNARIINENAVPGSLCEEAMQIFSQCYGSEAGVLALQFMPFRGLYVTGGVTVKALDHLTKNGAFMEAYRDKGRVSPFLKQVPVYVVKREDMGMRGAHLRAVMLLKQYISGIIEKLPPEMCRLAKEALVPPRSLPRSSLDYVDDH
eukprot:gnl/MRDRNA2_/MRDRNA2_58139_c0_seq1.p1 gnl/MRDRNA2_/MRDRNA2_58139_c0~~gnl/MRDRNA2_/MRDRNA2_58139_c0_seq1.p1  ORF type:complete len:528 (-),score=103.79 gnl/MRDRNA2_/MRDRNA2_58139_c0_seq1:110-1693(-)